MGVFCERAMMLLERLRRPFKDRMPPQGPGGSPICEGRDKSLAGARAVWVFQLRRKV